VLTSIYLAALGRCAPEVLVRAHVAPDLPRNVVAIGKCAGALLDGVAAAMPVERAFVAMPEGYRLPQTKAEVALGGHPYMTPASFVAGRRMVAFVDSCRDVLFLISGGGSACVELPLPPHSEAEVAEQNARLVDSGVSIGEINRRRKQVSAIKGGRLGERVRGRSVALIYSDVSPRALDDVASGPVRGGTLIADNDTLTSAAADLALEAGYHVRRWDGQLECDVEEAARALAAAGATLGERELLVAGGEPTVVKTGDGRGGRCSELAVRFALASTDPGLSALFASSDGLDGNSGVAGILLHGIRAFDREEAVSALARSDSYNVASRIGEAIMIGEAGNNLRDLFLLARG